MIRKVWEKVLNQFRIAQWNIGVIHKPIHEVLSGGDLQVTWLPELKHNGFVADPFAVHYQGSLYVFFEELDYADPIGRISYLKYEKGAQKLAVSTLWENQFHMSYPYIFTHKDDIYCIPETSESGEVVMYRAKNFPHDWEKFATILEGVSLLDCTIFQWNGFWWLFATDLNDASSAKLKIWYAKDLTSSWVEHQNNPVKDDSTSSRPAGTPFLHEGVLYRPAQDCSVAYGGRVWINRIEKLSPYEFSEIKVKAIDPVKSGEYKDGLHTLSSAGDVTFIDGRRWVPIGLDPARWKFRFKLIKNQLIKCKRRK